MKLPITRSFSEGLNRSKVDAYLSGYYSEMSQVVTLTNDSAI